MFVMRIGFMDDLTYYYLGRAAQELGYMQAAQRYYRIAERLSVTKCLAPRDMANVGNTFSLPTNICEWAMSFPDELYPHLEVVEARLAAPSTATEPSNADASTPPPTRSETARP